jgi:hypothetical protein
MGRRDDPEHYPADAWEGDSLVTALITGWFSFEQMGATAGDLLARDLACEWLQRAGYPYDVALAPPFHGGVNWRLADPGAYSHVVFVCGPFGNGEPLTMFLERFGGCRLVGLNLTMLESLETWNPFDLLLERDSSATSRPDISFLSRRTLVPVVGVVLIDTQPEYKERDAHEVASNAIRRLVASREMSAVLIDTRLDTNSTALRTTSEVESLIARMDVVLTTRVHGTVLALKNGVPPVVVDPVARGGKVRRQAETISWPVTLAADGLTDEALRQGFDYCLTEDARVKAQECRERATSMIQEVRDEFISSLARSRKMAED